jgi:hypothetical protein
MLLSGHTRNRGFAGVFGVPGFSSQRLGSWVGFGAGNAARGGIANRQWQMANQGACNKCCGPIQGEADRVRSAACEPGCRGPGKAHFPIWETGLPTIRVRSVWRTGCVASPIRFPAAALGLGRRATQIGLAHYPKGERERRADGGAPPKPGASGRGGVVAL